MNVLSPRRNHSKGLGTAVRDRRLSGAERKAQIVSATVRLLAEHGLADTTMSRIAAAVGVSDSALYKHFRSREDILLAAYQELAARNWAWINSAQAPNAIDRLHEIGETHARTLSEDVKGFNAPWFQFNSWTHNDPIREQVLKGHEEVREWLVSLIEEGKAQGSIRSDIATDLLLADFQALITWEDTSYLQGRDTETLRKISAAMLARFLDWAGGSPDFESADTAPAQQPALINVCDDRPTDTKGKKGDAEYVRTQCL